METVLMHGSEEALGGLSQDAGDDALTPGAAVPRKYQPGDRRDQSGPNKPAEAAGADESGDIEKGHLGRLRMMLEAGTADGQELGGLFLVALGQLEGDERRDYLLQATQMVVEENAELLGGILAQFDSVRDRHAVITTAIDRFLESDPADAAAWVEGLSPNAGRTEAAEILARGWAQEDVDGARDWVGLLPAGSEEAVKGNEGLVWAWMQQDREAVIEYVNGLEDSRVQRRASEKAAKILAVEDPASAVAWVAEFPEADLRSELVDYSLYRWAHEDSDAARSWVETVEDPSVRSGASSALIRAWADHDPAAATRWVMDNREGLQTDAPLLNATRQWAEQDPAAVSAWLQGVTDTQTQHQIMDNLTRIQVGHGTAAVGEWLTRFEDPVLRARGERVVGLSSP